MKQTGGRLQVRGGEVALRDAKLVGVDLSGLKLDRFDALASVLERCDLSGLRAERGRMSGVEAPTVYRQCRFAGSDLRALAPGAARFEACTFDSARMDGWLCHNCEFVGCRFSGRLADVVIFGALEGLEMAGLAVGSLAVPVLVHAGGVALALIAIGAALVTVSAATVTGLGQIADGLAAAPATVALVRRNPLFALLSPPVLEDLARALVPLRVAAGEAVVLEGEAGDRYYVVADGKLQVTIGAEPVRTLGQGDGFGEIALLRDGIRTATVSALQDTSLLALERAPFLEALGGSAQARRAADELVAERLAV